MTAPRSQAQFDVTVVIPTHNRWPLLRVALGTVLAQRDVHVRAIVIDGCSTDETRDALDCLDDERLLVVHEDMCRGVAAARNRGLAEVATEWVAFLDDDDVFGPDHVAAMLRAGLKRRDSARVGLVYGGHIVTDRQRCPLRAAPATSEDGVPAELLSANVLGPPSAILLRTEAVRTVGGFDERLSKRSDCPRSQQASSTTNQIGDPGRHFAAHGQLNQTQPSSSAAGRHGARLHSVIFSTWSRPQGNCGRKFHGARPPYRPSGPEYGSVPVRVGSSA